MKQNESQSNARPASVGPLPDDLLETSGARVSLWWSDTPSLDGEKIGAIGGFEAADGTAARKVLAMAEFRLREVGVRVAVGPMDGNTWRRYRWMVESDGRGPFFLEPWNPPEYPLWWKEAGFGRLAGYTSSVVDAASPPGASAAVCARFARSGFVIRRLEPGRYNAELEVIHDISVRSFTGNFLYTPLPAEAFVADYAKVSTVVDPECVMIVEREGKPCAFLFAIPDIAAVQRGERAALIAKTVAVVPEARRYGIGTILVDELQTIAHRKGYGEVIHALQHESNNVSAITGRLSGRVFRRYELFAKRL